MNKSNQKKAFEDQIKFSEQFILVDRYLDMHLENQIDYCLTIPDFFQEEVDLYIQDTIESNITIIVGNYVGIKIRLFILFASAHIKISIVTVGVQSKLSIVGMIVLADMQEVKIATEQIHAAENNRTDVIMHGLIADQAALQVQGLIRIEKNAFGSYALQNNKNILLSKQATAICIPTIEVLHNDVQCYHGAAVGRFDEAESLYMQSRGLDVGVIKQLLIQAFFADILHGYKKREFILQKVYGRL
ncbi:MAG: SufB/SufD family protein [Candidatus Chromulinivorax sp.]